MTDHDAHDDIDVATAARLADDGMLLLDVREQHEWDAGHAPTAVHMPVSRFDVSQLPPDRILAICRSGNRSGRAAMFLEDAGFAVDNMQGGMLAWVEADLPMAR